MPTANEKKALWFLSLIALSGTSFRLCHGNADDLSVADTVAIARQIGRVDSVRALRHKKSARVERVKPAIVSPSPEHPVDVDRASVEQIEALPGIGKSMALRLVAHRDSAGGFGHIEALCEVAGIRPNLLEKLRPLVTFTAPRRPLSVECGGASRAAGKPRGARTRQTR